MPGDSARINGRKGGRPKGSKSYFTVDKERFRQEYYARQHGRLAQVADAQFESAVGVSHMMAKDASGQWIEVTDPATMARCLNSGETFYKLTAVNPNVQAQNSFLDRMLDKPTEQLQVTGAEGGPLEIRIKKPW